MKNNFNLWAMRSATVTLLFAVILLVCGCSSFSKGSSAGASASGYANALPTDKIKLYFLPRYGQVKDDSPEWKLYETLVNDSMKFLAEQKACVAVNAGNISKEDLGKSNAWADAAAVLNPVELVQGLTGQGMNLQEKAIVNFVNNKFPSGNKEDSLILCLYVRPYYPSKAWGGVSPYPKAGAASVYSLGVSQVELGYVLSDPVKNTILNRRKVILSRDVDMGTDSQEVAAHWKFGEDQSAFLEKAVNRLFNEFPLARYYSAPRAKVEPLAVPVAPVVPVAVADSVVNNIPPKACADKKGYKITFESVDGEQWIAAIEPGGTKTQAGKEQLDKILKTFLDSLGDPGKAPATANANK